MFAVLVYHGTNNSPDQPLDSTFLILSAISIQWFSLFDMMDGNRARRLKIDSPLGRILDEGGDTLTQANYCTLIAYMWPMKGIGFELAYFALNYVFYAMEMKYTLTGKFEQVIGEIGCVEFELATTIIMLT